MRGDYRLFCVAESCHMTRPIHQKVSSMPTPRKPLFNGKQASYRGDHIQRKVSKWGPFLCLGVHRPRSIHISTADDVGDPPIRLRGNMGPVVTNL